MALVSYECSDSSDCEDSVEDKNEIDVGVNATTLIEEKSENSSQKETNDLKTKVKETLPPPVEIKSGFNVVSWDLLSKNRTQPIRISIPSLDEDNDVSETKPKIKPSSSKSGLFALLPKPKHQASGLIPHSLKLAKQNASAPTKTKQSITPPKKSVVKSSTKMPNPLQPPTASLAVNTSQDDDDDDEAPSSFFFVPESEIIEPPKDNWENILVTDEKILVGDQVTLGSEKPDPSSSSESPSVLPEDSSTCVISESQSEVELDKEALEKLCGRKRGKRLAGEIEMVDVNGQELVGDSKLWLAKELTTQKTYFKRSKFDPMQRRKHQITFLAAHAREQELELANQWANNRMTRKQTQAKYGF